MINVFTNLYLIFHSWSPKLKYLINVINYSTATIIPTSNINMQLEVKD